MAAIAIPTAQSLLAIYNVWAYGATGNGTTDDTSAIQAALTAAGNAGGAICYAPPGTYLIGGTLSIPAGVQMIGTWQTPAYATPPTSGWQSQSASTLLLTGNSGSANATPAVTVGYAGAIKGFVVYYPNQSTTASTPTAYPWAISLGINSAAECLELVNPYQGIYAQFGRCIVRDVFGQPLSYGLKVESSLDICRFEDVHFWPVWEQSFGANTPSSWMKANGTAFGFGRSDEQYCRGLFAYGYNVGFSLYNQTTGAQTGTTYGTFEGCSIDSCNTGISATTDYQGVAWIGGGIAANTTNLSLTGGAFSFTGTRFWSSGTPSFSHTGGNVSLNQCYIQSRMAITSSGSVFSFTNNVLGNASSTITLSGSGKATLVGNTLQGGTFSSIISGTMSGGTVTGSNN
jgi:hypothetical protein